MPEHDPKHPLARHGWGSAFPIFRDTSPRVIRGRLQEVIADASPEQVRAWDDSIPELQREVSEILSAEPKAQHHTAILEYELPLESRRPDVILLLLGAVVVLELKGKVSPSQADLDQVSAYARDLRCYHRYCADQPVHAVVVPMRARGDHGVHDGIHVVGPDALDRLVQQLQPKWSGPPLSPEIFLAEDAYRPLPTLVQAARELIQTGSLRRIHRARAATQPAIDEIIRIIHEAALTRTRRLVLLTGVPGAGKTLVGLQVVHSHFLDDLAIPRADGKPTAPAVFLSGNGPLVQVLQYELRGAGGDGKTFVRGVKDYVRRYSSGKHRIPPEHVLVFDEAQRAFDRDMVAQTHGQADAKSEPEHFVEFASRIPGWCVVVGLIGSGQEIHVGEEGGLVQWRNAVEQCTAPDEWKVHVPPIVGKEFSGSPVTTEIVSTLNLDTEIRFHLATELHRFVELLLSDGNNSGEANIIAERLNASGYHLRLTRIDGLARSYLKDRYRENPDARYGLLASSKDKDLESFGIPNDFQSTKRVQPGPWYGEYEENLQSCRHLRDCITEFQAQGLELDAVLLAWGTDFIRKDGAWSNARARGYKKGAKVRDAKQLRTNAYRVLLTRGRDGTIVFVPPIPDLEETASYLVKCGFHPMN